MNKEIEEKVNNCLYLLLDADELPTLRLPVLLHLLNPLYSLHPKPLLPVLFASVKILSFVNIKRNAK